LSCPAIATNGEKSVRLFGNSSENWKAGARRGRVGIDSVIEQPEAVILAHLLVERAHVGGLAKLKRDAKRIERRPPPPGGRRRCGR
jgi:hypothetical protein